MVFFPLYILTFEGISCTIYTIKMAETDIDVISTLRVRIINCTGARILVQVTIYRRLRIGRDGHLDQSEACDIS